MPEISNRKPHLYLNNYHVTYYVLSRLKITPYMCCYENINIAVDTELSSSKMSYCTTGQSLLKDYNLSGDSTLYIWKMYIKIGALNTVELRFTAEFGQNGTIPTHLKWEA